jgi:UDP-3-O-[3-hydroxymyristoyl] glucosamine N-acyltransferase
VHGQRPRAARPGRPQQLAFLANPKYLSQVETSGAGAVLIAPRTSKARRGRGISTSGPDGRPRTAGPSNFIVTANPYAYFARVAQMFIDLATPPRAAGVHPSATIDPSAQVAASAVIGPRDDRSRCGDRR